jgi:hypothetical protein
MSTRVSENECRKWFTAAPRATLITDAQEIKAMRDLKDCIVDAIAFCRKGAEESKSDKPEGFYR